MSFVAVNNFGDTRSGGLAGPMGAFIIVLMCIAVVLLIRNMNKRLRRLPDSFAEADAKRRADEIARLDADLQRSPTGRAVTRVDDDRSTGSAAPAETEVSDPGPAGEPRPGIERG